MLFYKFIKWIIFFIHQNLQHKTNYQSEDLEDLNVPKGNPNPQQYHNSNNYIQVSHFFNVKQNHTMIQPEMWNRSNFMTGLSRCGRRRRNRFTTPHCEPPRPIRHFRARWTLWDLNRMIIMMRRWWSWWCCSMSCGKNYKKKLVLIIEFLLSLVTRSGKKWTFSKKSTNTVAALMILSPSLSSTSAFVSIFILLMIATILKMVKGQSAIINSCLDPGLMAYRIVVPKSCFAISHQRWDKIIIVLRWNLHHQQYYQNDGDGVADVHASFCSSLLQFDHELGLYYPFLYRLLS